MVRLSSAVLGTIALLFSTATAITTISASGFVSKDSSLSFALNIPQDDDSNELYFTLSGTDSSWISIGMGNDKMENTLIFLAYPDSSGKNVTLSPRLSYGHVEPSYTSEVTIAILPGTQIVDGKMTVNAKCNNCRSWKKGSIDPKDTAAKFIYASGPGSWIDSSSLSADIKRHSSYGSFEMDLTKSVGIAGVPQQMTADTTGTKQTSDKIDHDFSVIGHAILMILAFLGLMPAAVIILRVLNSVKWHGITQVLSLFATVIGTGVGVYIGTMYNRTKSFNSAHQIIGGVVVLAMVGQFILGFLHHRTYKKTHATTKLAPIHVWLGRLVIPLGIVNGFLGFPLALDPKYNWALAALVLLMTIIIFPLSFWFWRRNNRRQKIPGISVEPTRHCSQPWKYGETGSNISLGQMGDPTPYQGQPAQEQRQFL